MLFVYTMKHSVEHTLCSDSLKDLPVAILKHTDWDYSYKETDFGCFLKPTFRNMPFRNSFVPEIDVVLLKDGENTVLQMQGKPVLFVRVFMAIWFAFLMMTEAVLIGLTIASVIGSIFPLLIPIGMCVFGYLLCALGTKVTFHSVVKAIRKELL